MQSLRGVTLPDEEVSELLRDEYVVGWRNIQKDGHVGMSNGYRKNQTAVGTTNGAGGRNVQLVVLAPDATVLHVLPGFWHPEDLVRELRFARVLHRLWFDEGKTRAEKERLFALLHKSHVNGFTADTIARSDWQGFDKSEELARYHLGPRDSVVLDDCGQPQLKPLCVLVHDRMLARPFQKLAAFDMESFVDYGRPYYDNNAWIDKGASFPTAAKANEKREQEKAKAEAAEAKAAKSAASRK